jgi:hypothetical protein
MLKAFSVLFHVIAGFFFYTVSVLAFADIPSISLKWGVMIGFSAPAVGALFGGLALTGFRDWRRDTGIVLLCASGLTTLIVFMFICLVMTEEFRKMMQPDALAFFNDYLTGGAVIVGLAALGCGLLITNRKQTK